MNGTTAAINDICAGLNAVNVPDNTRVVVGASPCYLTVAKAALTNDKVKVSAQNCFKADKGAFTGEVAPEMLK